MLQFTGEWLGEAVGADSFWGTGTWPWETVEGDIGTGQNIMLFNGADSFVSED